MNCEKIQDCMADYAVGLLSGRRRAEVARHIGECPACLAEFEKQERVMRLVGTLDPVEPPAGLWHRVYNEVSRTPVHPSVWKQLKEGHYRQGSKWSFGFATIALAALIFHALTSVQPPIAGAGAQEYVQGHVMYAGQEVLADQMALNYMAVVSERDHLPEGPTN